MTVYYILFYSCILVLPDFFPYILGSHLRLVSGPVYLHLREVSGPHKLASSYLEYCYGLLVCYYQLAYRGVYYTYYYILLDLLNYCYLYIHLHFWGRKGVYYIFRTQNFDFYMYYLLQIAGS